LNELVARGHAIAKIVFERRDATRDFGADDDILARRERTDDVDGTPDVANFSSFDFDLTRSLLARRGASACRTAGGERERQQSN
jgi:hypothetical protein